MDMVTDHAHYEEMDATLLSRQALSPPTETPKKRFVDDWMALYKDLSGTLEQMRIWRWSWWAFWSVLAEYFLPRRYHWVVVANRTSRGSNINQAILDSTGVMAVRTCAAGMWTGLTSPSRPWFILGSALTWDMVDDAGRQWLAHAEKVIYDIFANSNFYDVMAQAFQDVTVFGTAPVIVYADKEDVARFYLPCAGEYFLGLSARLVNDAFAREFTMTVKQIVDMFGLEQCPGDVQALWKNGSRERELVVQHIIRPNIATPDAKGDKRLRLVPEKFTWMEGYWLKGMPGEQPLSLKGETERTFFVARGSVVSNDPYGRSIGMDAIGDNRQVQQETRRKGEFIEKGVRPPMGADPELKNEPSSIMPGNVTFVNTSNNKKGFWPLFEPNPQWLTGITADIDTVNKRIEACMYVPTFMAISRMEGVQPRNELELTKRDLERLQELGPFIDLFEREFAGPIVQRVFNLALEKRLLRNMPPSIAGAPLKLTYVSIMRIAQKSAEAVSMKDFLQVMGGLSSASKAAGIPDPLRTINLDDTARKYAEVVNFPSELFFSKGAVAQHDQVRQQEAQKAQMPNQAMAAVNAAKTLSQTSLPGGNTALGAMLGQGGQQ